MLLPEGDCEKNRQDRWNDHPVDRGFVCRTRRQYERTPHYAHQVPGYRTGGVADPLVTGDLIGEGIAQDLKDVPHEQREDESEQVSVAVEDHSQPECLEYPQGGKYPWRKIPVLFCPIDERCLEHSIKERHPKKDSTRVLPLQKLKKLGERVSQEESSYCPYSTEPKSGFSQETP